MGSNATFPPMHAESIDIKLNHWDYYLLPIPYSKGYSRYRDTL